MRSLGKIPHVWIIPYYVFSRTLQKWFITDFHYENWVVLFSDRLKRVDNACIRCRAIQHVFNYSWACRLSEYAPKIRLKHHFPFIPSDLTQQLHKQFNSGPLKAAHLEIFRDQELVKPSNWICAFSQGR